MKFMLDGNERFILREDVTSHHYIISFDLRDAPDNGLTVDRAQKLGEEFCKGISPYTDYQ